MSERFSSPHSPRSTRQPGAVALLAEPFDRPADGREQRAFVVAREEDVVAASEQVPFGGAPVGEEPPEVVRPVELHEPRGPLRHAEAVAGGEVDVMKFSNHDAQS